MENEKDYTDMSIILQINLYPVYYNESRYEEGDSIWF